jgi:predicted site-specific integrase-resolvase
MVEVVDFKGRTEGTRDIESRVPNPRLMNLHAAAAYIGVSYWTMRDYVLDGIVPHVILPCSRRRKKGGAVVRRAGDVEARRKHVERADLDRLIEKCKRQAEQSQNN